MSNALRDKLKSEVMATDFAALGPHFARGALILVAVDVDLLDVAECVARDQRARVEAWLKAQHIWRASDADAQAAVAGAERFQFVIVQPWVLAQKLA